MKILYKETKFRNQSLAYIDYINNIIEEYQAKGYELTLRQVYYQLVARGIIDNNERSYKNIGNLISDGRLAGLIDWDAIIDRTRLLRGIPHWNEPAEIIKASSEQFRLDKWRGQDNYVEVWVEKDALVGVVGKACSKLDIPYLSCRGYVSQTEMWNSARRLASINLNQNRRPIIIHLGDHDPSGKDMSRDIVERLNTFGVDPEFRRIALNMDQVEQYNPPPNPTKLTDTRCTAYIEEFGDDCWELDALKPEVIDSLITATVNEYLDLDLFRAVKKEEYEHRRLLEKVSNNWDKIVRDL